MIQITCTKLQTLLSILLIVLGWCNSMSCDDWASLISTPCADKLVTNSGEISLNRDGTLASNNNNDVVRISYKEYYHEDASTSYDSLTPILIVHGGPGLPYTYLDTYKYLVCDEDGNNNGYRVIFYDQFCVGTSAIDCTPSTASDFAELNEMSRYMNEMKSVIDVVIDDKEFHLLGQSGGGALVSQFGVTYNSFVNSGQVLSLILANPASPNFKMFSKGLHDNVLGSLPLKYRDVLQPNDVSNDIYGEAYSFYETVIFLRSGEVPDCILNSFDGFNEHVFTVMQADCDWCYWSARGGVGNLDITNDISNIYVPILYFFSQFDIIGESDALLFAANNHETTLYLIQGASHLSHIESFDETYKLVDCWMDESCVVPRHNVYNYQKAKQKMKSSTPQFTR
eukprot:UN00229